MACNFRDWQMEASRNGFCIGRVIFLSFLFAFGQRRRSGSGSGNPTGVIRLCPWHRQAFTKPTLFLGDLGGTFRKERMRARE